MIKNSPERQNNQDDAEWRRLKWHCRRGLLELDVLLERFLNEEYRHLSPAEQATFARLLECTDPELLSWLLGSETPGDLALREMVGKIKHQRKYPRQDKLGVQLCKKNS